MSEAMVMTQSTLATCPVEHFSTQKITTLSIMPTANDTENFSRPTPVDPTNATSKDIDKMQNLQDTLRIRCSFTTDCLMTFSRKDHLERHLMRYHTAKKDAIPFQCRYCTKKNTAFETRFDLEQHIQVSHANAIKIDTYPCPYDQCTKKYSKKEHLIRHQKSAGHVCEGMERITYQCDLCNANFAYKHGLNRHKRRSHAVHSLRPFQCSLCLLSFTKKHELQAHTFVHTGVVPFSCKLCEQSFMKRYQLVKHEKSVHAMESGVAPVIVHINANDPILMVEERKETSRERARDKELYTCLLCEQQFCPGREYRAHIRTHLTMEGERFQCPFQACEKSYSKKSNLMSHICAVHDFGQSQQFLCPIVGCDGVFAYKHTLNKHLERIHAREAEITSDSAHRQRRKTEQRPISLIVTNCTAIV